MKIEECRRTDASQPSSFFLQIAKIYPDWQGKLATINEFFNRRYSGDRPSAWPLQSSSPENFKYQRFNLVTYTAVPLDLRASLILILPLP